MSKKRVVASHIVKLLKSRQMVIAVSTLFVSLLVLALPDLKPIREELLTFIITLALAIIGGYTLQENGQSGDKQNIEREELRELVEDVLQDMASERTTNEEASEEKQQLPASS
jgi:hypothetical protein